MIGNILVFFFFRCFEIDVLLIISIEVGILLIWCLKVCNFVVVFLEGEIFLIECLGVRMFWFLKFVMFLVIFLSFNIWFFWWLYIGIFLVWSLELGILLILFLGVNNVLENEFCVGRCSILGILVCLDVGWVDNLFDIWIFFGDRGINFLVFGWSVCLFFFLLLVILVLIEILFL